MRIKKTATRSMPFIRLANHCNFAASLLFIQPTVDLSLVEKKFCKENSIIPKTFMEIKSIYKRKGKNGVKHFMKSRKMSGSKITVIIEFLKGEDENKEK